MSVHTPTYNHSQHLYPNEDIDHRSALNIITPTLGSTDTRDNEQIPLCIHDHGSTHLHVIDDAASTEPYTQTSTILLEYFRCYLHENRTEQRQSAFGKLIRKFIRSTDWITLTVIDGCRTDIDMYKQMFRYKHDASLNTVSDTTGLDMRSERRALEIADIFTELMIPITNCTYLDFGCSNGLITGAIGRKLNMREIWGIDMSKWHGVENTVVDDTVKFHAICDDGAIPVDKLPQSIDLITVIMVLHHIPPTVLASTIGTLIDLLVPGGYLLLREHNAITTTVVDHCHIEHAMYDLVMPNVPFWNFYHEYISNYHPTDWWETLIVNAGLELVYTSRSHGPTQYTWMLFSKPKN